MKQKQLIASITVGMLLGACGSSNDEETPVIGAPIYTGSEEKAVIDDTTIAQGIIREMFGLGNIEADPNTTTEDDSEAPKPEPYNILIPQSLTESIERINTDLAVDSIVAEKTLNTVHRCQDDQGKIDYAITIDDLTGTFSGHMHYTDCLSSGFMLTGSAEVTGNYDLLTNSFLKINFNFPWLRAENDDVVYTAAGTMGSEFTDLTTTTRLHDYVVTVDNLPVVKFEGYAIVLTDDDVTRGLILSGKFFHPTHGFVTVYTDGSLSFTQDIVWPYFGPVNMEGDKVDPEEGNTLLRMLCEDNAQYTLWLDADGDGIYDAVTFVDWL